MNERAAIIASPPRATPGIIHNFVMVNAMHDTFAAKTTVRQASEFLRAPTARQG
jgi:hypothetical protein